MRVHVAAVVLIMILAIPSPANAAGRTRFCGTHTYQAGLVLNVFASTGIKCKFAKRHARAVFQRRRCAKGWRYTRRSPNSFCTRRGRIYFAIRLKT